MGFLSTQATTTNIQTVSPGILVPSGVVFPFAGSVAPSGYLLCDGTSYNTTIYAALFSAIGYAYGGSGANFNVPDYRYSFLRGNGNQISVNGTGNAASNQVTFTTNHGIIRSGMRVKFNNIGALTNVTTTTPVFAVVTGLNTLSFASTYSNAVNAVPTLISIGTGSASAVVLVQWEDPDITTRLQSAVGGNATGLGTRQDDQFTSHSHSITSLFDGGTTTDNAFKSSAYFGGQRSNGTSLSGGNQTNPRNVYVNYIIKT